MATDTPTRSKDEMRQLARDMGIEVPQTEAEKVRAELLLRLAELGGRLTSDDEVAFEGTRFVIPATLDLQGAIEFLKEKVREDERTVAFTKKFNFRPMDGARATARALKKAFGIHVQRPIQTFFGDIPPELRDVQVSLTETEQVPWGRMGIPGLEGLDIYLGATHDPELGPLFHIRSEGPRKFRHHIEGLYKLIEEELRTNSVYRGKAFDGQDEPKFLDLSGVDPSRVVYSEEVMAQLDANIWSVIKYRHEMHALNVSTKRAVLFEGPYGTGKTLAAFLTAKLAEANGWTFIYCRPGKDDIAVVMQTARLYEPAVVFFEDVDVIAQPGEPDAVSRLLDIFDGIQSKGTEIMVVLTTNHVERIHKGMVRPGRLDAVIHIGSMDRQGVERLIKSLVPEDKLAEDVDFDEVFAAMEGFLPAFVKETVERTIRYAVARSGGTMTTLQTSDFVFAAHGLRPQLELMEGAREHEDLDPIGLQLGRLVDSSVAKHVLGARLSHSSDPEQGDTFGYVHPPIELASPNA